MAAMGRETLEPHELVENEEAGGGRLRNSIAVAAATLAVLASLSALQAERTIGESIIEKNEAVLSQSRASDEWAYRQAKSIKLHLQQATAGGATDTEQQRADIAASETRAREAEAHRDEANRASAEWFEEHHRFAAGTSLLQIAIVLTTVAGVLDSSALFIGGLSVGALGLLAFVNGFVGLV